MQAARLYVVSKSILCNKINWRREQALDGFTKQRVTLKEEESIVIETQSWGFSPKKTQLQKKSEELL